jgi:hypothetical protein
MALSGSAVDALCLVELRGFEPLTPCMPCSFGLLPHPRSEAGAKLNGLLRVTVSVPWIPLVTAAYGTQVAQPARTTTLAPDGDGSSSTAGRGPSSVTIASWARGPRARGSRVGRLELHCALVRRPRSGSYTKAELQFLRSLGDRFYPWLSIASPTVADPARTRATTAPAGSGPLPLTVCSARG